MDNIIVMKDRNVVHGTANIVNISLESLRPLVYSDYLSKKAGDVAEKDITIIDEAKDVATAARMMRDERISSILVSRNNIPVGIVTEKDILYRVVAENKGPFKTLLKEVMSTPLVTMDETTLVKDAIYAMRNKDIRRMPITRNGKIISILTLRSIVGNTSEGRIELADTELPVGNQVMCPYCQSKFESKQDLSKHIDRLHLGSGLLEGDLRQW
jgi:signal-transduction protein with cAMP-binding, CBS, and nucleotidyltransferase domain